MANQATATAEPTTEQARTDTKTGPSQGQVARRSIPALLPLGPLDFLNPLFLMNRVLSDVTRSGSDDQAWMPAIEATEHDGNYVVRAELPGIKPEEVKIEVKGNALVLEGERRLQREQNSGGVHRTEIRYGRFYRVVPMPEGANVEQARARFDDGVLEVTVPLPEQQSRRREIPIEANSTTQADNRSTPSS